MPWRRARSRAGTGESVEPVRSAAFPAVRDSSAADRGIVLLSAASFADLVAQVRRDETL